MATQTQMPERNRAPLSIAGLAKDSGRNTCNKRPPYRHSSPNMTTCISRIPVISNMNIWLAAFRQLELECEQIFERETAVKLLRSFAVEYGDVNPDVSYLRANCDGSLLKLPCCTANGFWAMPQVPNPLNDPQTAGLPCDSFAAVCGRSMTHPRPFRFRTDLIRADLPCSVQLW